MLTEAELQALLLSVQVGLVATLVALPPATLLAFWLARTQSRWRVLVEAIVVLPMVLPPVVVGYFLLVLLGREGWLGAWLRDSLGVTLPFTWLGAALAAMVMGFPLMVRAMRQAFEGVDPGLEEAASVLGASRLGVFWSVSVAGASRGLLAGTILCFARSLGEFGATIMFAGNIEGQTRTLPLAIWSAFQRVDGSSSAWRLVMATVVLALLATLASELLVRRWRRGITG